MSNQLEIIVKESGLETVESQTIMERFGNYEEISKEWETKAKMIVVNNATQTTEMAMAREARKKFSNMRIEIEKTRKSMKEQSLRKGQVIDSVARYITSLITPIETYLKQQEDFVQIEEAKKAEEARLAEEARIESERIAKEKADAEERERLRIENEKLKKEMEAKELESQKEKAKAQAVLDEQIAKAKQERETAQKEKERSENALRLKMEESERANKEKEKALMAQKIEAEKKQKEMEAKVANLITCPKCKFEFSIK